MSHYIDDTVYDYVGKLIEYDGGTYERIERIASYMFKLSREHDLGELQFWLDVIVVCKANQRSLLALLQEDGNN